MSNLQPYLSPNTHFRFSTKSRLRNLSTPSITFSMTQQPWPFTINSFPPPVPDADQLRLLKRCAESLARPSLREEWCNPAVFYDCCHVLMAYYGVQKSYTYRQRGSLPWPDRNDLTPALRNAMRSGEDNSSRFQLDWEKIAIELSIENTYSWTDWARKLHSIDRWQSAQNEAKQRGWDWGKDTWLTILYRAGRYHASKQGYAFPFRGVTHPLDDVKEFLAAHKLNICRLNDLVEAVVDDPQFLVILDSITIGRKDRKLVFRQNQLMSILYPDGITKSRETRAYQTVSGMGFLVFLRAKEILDERGRPASHWFASEARPVPAASLQVVDSYQTELLYGFQAVTSGLQTAMAEVRPGTAHKTEVIASGLKRMPIVTKNLKRLEDARQMYFTFMRDIDRLLDICTDQHVLDTQLPSQQQRRYAARKVTPLYPTSRPFFRPSKEALAELEPVTSDTRAPAASKTNEDAIYDGDEDEEDSPVWVSEEQEMSALVDETEDSFDDNDVSELPSGTRVDLDREPPEFDFADPPVDFHELHGNVQQLLRVELETVEARKDLVSRTAQAIYDLLVAAPSDPIRVWGKNANMSTLARPKDVTLEMHKETLKREGKTLLRPSKTFGQAAYEDDVFCLGITSHLFGDWPPSQRQVELWTKLLRFSAVLLSMCLHSDVPHLYPPAADFVVQQFSIDFVNDVDPSAFEMFGGFLNGALLSATVGARTTQGASSTAMQRWRKACLFPSYNIQQTSSTTYSRATLVDFPPFSDIGESQTPLSFDRIDKAGYGDLPLACGNPEMCRICYEDCIDDVKRKLSVHTFRARRGPDTKLIHWYGRRSFFISLWGVWTCVYCVNFVVIWRYYSHIAHFAHKADFGKFNLVFGEGGAPRLGYKVDNEEVE